MAYKYLKDIELGTIVKVRENSGLVNYRIIHKGSLPSYSYDPSCFGIWAIRTERLNDAITFGTSVNYDESNVHKYLNSEFISSISAEIRSKLQTVKLPYYELISEKDVQLHISDGVSCKAFILSCYEAGRSGSSGSGGPFNPGSKLDYYTNNLDTQNQLTSGWSRSLYETSTVDDGMTFFSDRMCTFAKVQTVSHNGFTTVNINSKTYVFPVIVFPTTGFMYDESTLEVIPNRSPNTPSSITIPETIRGGEDTSIIWSAATDSDGNLDGYIVERSYNGGSSWSQIYQGRETSTTTTIPFGTGTVMFRVCAYDTYGEKSGWRTSANKTVVNNRAPAAPPSISVPLSPSGGDKLTITWTASTDVDGNLEGYELERQWDGAGAFTQIYKGAALSFQDDIPKADHTSVVYRVRAYDSFASYSSYTTSPSRTIDNNTAPVIACDLSGNLGEKSEGFSVPYTVSDAEQQEVTVVERVGDLVKRTYKATLDEQATFEITDEYFQRILNGAQIVQIVATDSAGKSSTLSLTFTKKVHKAVITLSEPLAVEEQITVAVLAITGKIPADATQLVELTNNGNDAEPVWEDATADVKAGRNYVFKNKSQSAGWAFNFRVTVERGESGEDGNIVSIQGGFQ